VTYTVSVSNSSNAGDIVIDQICDTAYGNIFTVAGFTGPACAPGSAGAKTGTTCTALDIAPGQIGTCTFTAVQGENATVINTVSVSGHSAINPSSTFPPTGSNSVTVTSTDAPSTAMVTKGIDSTTAGCATVRYTVDVHNSSGADEVLTLSAFNDSAFGSITTVQGSVLGTTCGVASGAGTLSGATGGGALPATLAVGGSGSDYTCKFDAQFCGALTTITTTLGTCNGITCSAGRTGSTCTQNSDCDVTCNGLQHINKVTATLNGDEGTTDPVTQTGNTLTVKECFASSVSSATP
jgi:hypothetical protein